MQTFCISVKSIITLILWCKISVQCGQTGTTREKQMGEHGGARNQIRQATTSTSPLDKSTRDEARCAYSLMLSILRRDRLNSCHVGIKQLKFPVVLCCIGGWGYGGWRASASDLGPLYGWLRGRAWPALCTSTDPRSSDWSGCVIGQGRAADEELQHHWNWNTETITTLYYWPLQLQVSFEPG